MNLIISLIKKQCFFFVDFNKFDIEVLLWGQSFASIMDIFILSLFNKLSGVVGLLLSSISLDT